MNKKSISIIFIISILFFGCKKDNSVANKLYLQSLDAYSKNDFLLCIKLVEKAIDLNENLIQGKLLLAKSYFFLDENSKALKCLEKIIKDNPEFTDARIWNIRILIFSENFQQAKKYLENELRINQTDWRVYYLYSLLAKAEGDFETQISMLEKAEIALIDGAKVFGEISEIWQGLGLEERANENLNKQKIIIGSSL
ncbi:MAG: hypothetical protein J6B32_03795 [Spirochaetaceae bacterium]|nr:hypothetical protein [Spirochaetaceae bacterium]